MKHALSIAMTGAAICLSAGLQAMPAIVQVPDPAQSSVDACLVFGPGGDIDFHITVRNINSKPILGAQISIFFHGCPNVVLCPPQPGDGYTVAPGPVIETTTNLAGEVVLGIRGGGVCDEFEQVDVRADGILIATVKASSPDQDGNLLVDSADQAILNTKLNNDPSDPTGDLNCDGTIDSQDTGILNSHLGHDCNTPSPPGPSPIFSEVDPCLVICPAGDLAFRVLAKDDDDLPMPGALILISFISGFDKVEICPPRAQDGYTIKPGPAVEAVADGNGEAIFNIRGGGVFGVAFVAVDSVVIAQRAIASTDQNGDLLVDQSDLAIITSKATGNTTDPTGDLTCDGMVGPLDVNSVANHSGHSCAGIFPFRKFNFLDLRFDPLFPLPGPLRFRVDVTNISTEPTDDTQIQFRAAPLGAFLPWTVIDGALIPPLLPGETAEVFVTAETNCSYQSCPATSFCTPECAIRNGKPELRVMGTAQAQPLPPPPTGVFPCPPDHWGGNVDVLLEGEQQVVLHQMDAIPASLGHPVYVHVCVGDNSGNVYDWALGTDQMCQGWNIKFVAESADGEPLPDVEMSNPIIDSGCGFICLTPNPDAQGPCWVNLLVTDSGGEVSVVELHFDSSLCAPTQIEATSWGRVKATYR